MEFTDYYATLGVSRDADPAAIKAAYRKLARRLHPDVNSDQGAEARFKKVNEAYEVLKDDQKRAKYDRLGANWQEIERQEGAMRQARSSRRTQGAGAASGFSDFFETFFGGGGIDLDDLVAGAGRGSSQFHFRRGGSPQQVRGRDIEEEVEVALEEAAMGGVRLLTIGDRQIEMRIPSGVTAGSVVRVAGEGSPGLGGGARGDVLLRVRLRPDGRFSVSGRDLRADVVVRDDIAILGGEVEVAGLSGSVRVAIPAGTRAGRTLRLRGRGLPGLRGAAGGDLLLTVRIGVPAAPTADEVELYRRLATLRGGLSRTTPAATSAVDEGPAATRSQEGVA